ncbi:MAG: hypothetical protein IJX65_07890 [Alistipes sp.]|nr:hypothetical protein [Alistipes sp.]
MRRLKLLLVLTLLLSGTVIAQERQVEHSEDGQTVTVIRTLPKRIDQHNFRVGVGTMSFSTLLYHLSYADTGGPFTFRESVKDAETYLTNSFFTGVYSLNYSYHSRRWLQCGGTVNFWAITQSERDCVTNNKVENYCDWGMSIMPTFRFIYLYREKVQLYSSISAGIVVGNVNLMPCIDATLIGCSFGRKLYGFAELGLGTGGWGRIGIGYRFDSKKAKK